jgi:hypothetical protein
MTAACSALVLSHAKLVIGIGSTVRIPATGDAYPEGTFRQDSVHEKAHCEVLLLTETDLRLPSTSISTWAAENAAQALFYTSRNRQNNRKATENYHRTGQRTTHTTAISIGETRNRSENICPDRQ